MGGSESKSLDCDNDPRIEVADFDFRDEATVAAANARHPRLDIENFDKDKAAGAVLLKRILTGWQQVEEATVQRTLPSPPPPRRFRHLYEDYENRGCFSPHARRTIRPDDRLDAALLEPTPVEKALEALEYDRIYTAVIKTPVRACRSLPFTVNNNEVGASGVNATCVRPSSTAAVRPAVGHDWLQHRPHFRKGRW
jgi:hypothetical protein